MEQDAKDWLAERAPVALQILAASGHRCGQASFERVSRSVDAQVYRIDLDGKSYIAKGFIAETHDARKAFDRETQMLAALRGTGLAAGLVGANAAHGLIVMDHLAGPTVAEALHATCAEDLCFRIGQWHGRFDQRMKHVPCDSTWAEYLSHYPDDQIGSSLRDVKQWLRELPLREMAIARNDGFLGNYLLRDDGDVIGLDFAAAAMKPVGWDILVLARQLRRDAPDIAARGTTALLDGWGRGTESLDRAQFAQLTHRFADATRHLGPGDE